MGMTAKEKMELKVIATVVPKEGCDTVSVKDGKKGCNFNVNPNFPDLVIKNMVRTIMHLDQKVPIIIRRQAMTA